MGQTITVSRRALKEFPDPVIVPIAKFRIYW